MKVKNENVFKITASAVLLALGCVLSVFKIPMPFGGSVTAASMVPVCLIPIMFGTSWGAYSCFVYGLLQLFLGLKNFSYATWWGAVIGIVLFDYLLAFGGLCLCGVFKNLFKNKSLGCVVGTAAGCFFRFICHFISGVTVWRELTGLDAVWYSLGYNATYMLPELIITTFCVFLLLRSKQIQKIAGI